MHPAWYLEDIRSLIFDCSERRDLARLARTSQTLFHLATEPLWKTIDSFEALVCCLPPGFGDRPLRREDIQRLDFYSSKVRHLKVETDIDSPPIRLPPRFRKPKTKAEKEVQCKKPWKALWEEIAELRPPSESFRNLRLLRISNVAEELLVPLIGISGLHLTNIYCKFIQNRLDNSIIPRILDGLQDTPNLEYLFVRDGESGLVPRKLIQQAPLRHLRLDRRKHWGWDMVKRAQESPIQSDVFQKSTIEHLTIALDNDWCAPEIQALEGGYLPALKTLWLSLLGFTPGSSYCKPCEDSGAPGWVCECPMPDHSITNNAKARRDPRQSAPAFFEGLDNPELTLLNIKFPKKANGRMVLDLVSAANRSCRLQNLTELGLAGSEANFDWGDQKPRISPEELRMATKILLPLPKLKKLRLSVAPNFLDILDLDLYRSITEGFPALETLWLGHSDFAWFSEFTGWHYLERVPISHLAAFCQMLPHLVEVSIGVVEAEAWGTASSPEFVCSGVTSLRISRWAQGEEVVPPEQLVLIAQAYFPNANYR
jgi:hypothetical protein